MNIKDFDGIELSPCPFCGREAIIVRHPRLINPDNPVGEQLVCVGTWYVGCPYPFFEDLYPQHRCEIAPAAKWYAHLEDAIKWWENRDIFEFNDVDDEVSKIIHEAQEEYYNKLKVLEVQKEQSNFCSKCGLPLSIHK